MCLKISVMRPAEGKPEQAPKGNDQMDESPVS
jgi:hypothetical protein